jgi:hypothetical protein
VAYRVDLRRSRLPAAILLVGSVALAHLPSAVGLPCPIRSVTGVPCPFCGVTTGLRELGGGHVARSVATAPLAALVAALSVWVVTGRAPGRVTLGLWLILPVLGAEWVYELFRFGLL